MERVSQARVSSDVEKEELPLPLLVSLYVRASGLTSVVVYTWMAKGKISPFAREHLEALTEEVHEAARRQVRQLREAEQAEAARQQRAA